MKHDPLDAAELALCWWDVSFQFVHYDSAEKQRQRSSCFLNDIRGALLSGILTSDRLVYGRSWPTADVRIRHQRGTPTRWGLALLHCIRIMALIHHYSRDFSAATQGLDDSMAADDSMARRYEQTFSIRPEVSASARRPDDTTDVTMTRCQRKLQCR